MIGSYYTRQGFGSNKAGSIKLIPLQFRELSLASLVTVLLTVVNQQGLNRKFASPIVDVQLGRRITLTLHRSNSVVGLGRLAEAAIISSDPADSVTR